MTAQNSEHGTNCSSLSVTSALTFVLEASGTTTKVHFLVFYPNAPSNRRRHEYGQRVREIERGVFTPLVYSQPGGEWARDLIASNPIAIIYIHASAPQ